MIPLLKAAAVAGVAGVTSILAMCVTTPVKLPHFHAHSHIQKKHHKIVEEFYTPTATPAPSFTPPPTMATIAIPESDPLPRIATSPHYRTVIHKHPPWSSNYKPDQ
jgi:hypothetical protein